MKSTFKVITGVHLERGKEFKAGDTIQSNYDLVALYPGKFTLVATQVPAEEDEAPAQAEAPKQPTPVASASTFGADVTAEFPNAVEADLRVYRKVANFFVVDPSNPTVALNDKALKKADVSKFITTYLA